MQIDADPEPAYHFDADLQIDADPDPAYQFYANQDPDPAWNNVINFLTDVCLLVEKF